MGEFRINAITLGNQVTPAIAVNATDNSWSLGPVPASSTECGRYLSRVVDPPREAATPSPQTFAVTGPTSGTYHGGPDGQHPVDGRQRRRRQQDQPLLRHRHHLQRQRALDRDRRRGGRQRRRHYTWNTTGVAPGTYYLAGYMYDGAKTFTISHLTQAITITARPSQTFAVTGPTSGTLCGGQLGHHPVDGRQRRRRQQDQPLLRHRHHLQRQRALDRDRRRDGRQRRRHVHLEHHRRGGGHVLHRRLHVRRRQDLHVLAPHPGDHDHEPSGRRRSRSPARPPAPIRRAVGRHPMDGRQRRRRQQDQPLLRHRHHLQRQRALDRDRRRGGRQRRRHVHLEHHRRGGGHVLRRRLHVRRQQDLHLLAPHPGDHHHSAPAQTFALTGPTSGTLCGGQLGHASNGRPATSSPAARSASATTPTPPSTATSTGSKSTAWPAANGSGTYTWNTTGVAPGTYYIAGYMYDGSKTFTFSHLDQAITITASGVGQTFALTGPTSGTIRRAAVTIAWTAANVVAGSKISLCYDTDTTFNGNEHWIEIDGVAAANGAARTPGTPPAWRPARTTSPATCTTAQATSRSRT